MLAPPRCVCGHWKGMHFRNPPGVSQPGGCMRPTEQSPSCACRGFEAQDAAPSPTTGRAGEES